MARQTEKEHFDSYDLAGAILVDDNSWTAMDVLRALDYFRRAGADPDPRMVEAVEDVRSKRQPDGRWLLDRIHPGRVHFDLDDGVGAPSRWNSFRSLRVLDWFRGARAAT